MKIKTQNAKATMALGKALGKNLRANDCLALWGDFGSGKTTFVKGLAAGLAVKRLKDVASPSFVILKIYEGRLPLYHFDLYRLGRTRDCLAIGMDEFVVAGGVAAIEWPKAAEGALPPGTLGIEFKVGGSEIRTLNFKIKSARHRQMCKGLDKENFR